MKAIRGILITSLMFAGAALAAAQDTSAQPLQDKAAALARVKLLEGQIQALQTELNVLKAIVAATPPAAITVSVEPRLKSAEPLPELAVSRRAAKRNNSKNLAKAYK